MDMISQISIAGETSLAFSPHVFQFPSAPNILQILVSFKFQS